MKDSTFWKSFVCFFQHPKHHEIQDKITKINGNHKLIITQNSNFNSISASRKAKPVEDESPLSEDIDEIGKGMEEEETPIRSEDGESPDMFLGDEGSGESEGSAPWITAAESEMGSGDYWTDNLQQEGIKGGKSPA